MPIPVNIEGVGKVNFPDDYTPDRIKFAIENDILPRMSKSAEPEKMGGVGGVIKDIGMGALKGASDIGTTLLRPVDAALNATGITDTTNQQRRESLKGFFAENANPESLPFKGGELAADIAGTAGVGGVLAKGAGALGAAPRIVSALESGGFKLGPTAGRVPGAAIRAGAGAAVGGASAGLVNPDDAGAGAVIGGVLPGAVKAAGAAGSALAPKVSPEVASLYAKAKALGVDIPVDRIINNRPVNAIASSLNYLPLSGRAATEEKMVSQLNRAVSRTFGQDTDNITGALRAASLDLGHKFDRVLSTNTVKVDQQFLGDLVGHLQTAKSELGDDAASIIEKQVDQILAKTNASGALDGQAAYNIKKTLDRIGNRNSNEAFYARELKRSLMGALDRSLGPQQSAAFAKVRQQYGNMMELENLAQNGAEGGVSIGRLANLKNINNPDLQDIADIAAQFVKTRESPHGAAQRVMLGTLGLGAAGATGTLPLLAGGVVAGRTANTVLNSGTLKNALVNQQPRQLEMSPTLRALMYQSSP